MWPSHTKQEPIGTLVKSIQKGQFSQILFGWETHRQTTTSTKRVSTTLREKGPKRRAFHRGMMNIHSTLSYAFSKSILVNMASRPKHLPHSIPSKWLEAYNVLQNIAASIFSLTSYSFFKFQIRGRKLFFIVISGLECRLWLIFERLLSFFSIKMNFNHGF